jgi:hypothetical protein
MDANDLLPSVIGEDVCTLRSELSYGAKKETRHKGRVVILFAVTHLGPAQGGKAGGLRL